MKGMMARTPLRDLGRKFTNHSARQTSVRKSSGYVNSQIKNVTGHNNETSLEAYDSGDDNEMYGLSCVSSNVTPSDQSNKENETSPKSQLTSTSTLSKQEAFKKMLLEKNFSFGVFSEGPQKNMQRMYWSKS